MWLPHFVTPGIWLWGLRASFFGGCGAPWIKPKLLAYHSYQRGPGSGISIICWVVWFYFLRTGMGTWYLMLKLDATHVDMEVPRNHYFMVLDYC